MATTDAMTHATDRPRDPAELPQEGSLLLHVGGMSCAGCVRTVEQVLLNQPGVVKASVNLVTESALVEFAPGSRPDPEHLARILTEAGFPSSCA
ncbi:heavy-metal-associated domain-containing protein, partial [Synechococcus sp. H55.11]